MDDITFIIDEWAISSCHLIRLIAGGPTNLPELLWIHHLNPWKGKPKEKPQLTVFTRSGDKESTKMHQEKGREEGISKAKATANPRSSGNILVYVSPLKRVYIWPNSYHLMQKCNRVDGRRKCG